MSVDTSITCNPCTYTESIHTIYINSRLTKSAVNSCYSAVLNQDLRIRFFFFSSPPRKTKHLKNTVVETSQFFLTTASSLQEKKKSSWLQRKTPLISLPNLAINLLYNQQSLTDSQFITNSNCCLF